MTLHLNAMMFASGESTASRSRAAILLPEQVLCTLDLEGHRHRVLPQALEGWVCEHQEAFLDYFAMFLSKLILKIINLMSKLKTVPMLSENHRPFLSL